MSDFFYLPKDLFHLSSFIDKTDDDSELQIYSYSSCSNDDSVELKAYRGLVFDHSILVASSLGFTPEYNEESKNIEELKDISEYSFYKSEEGTLLRVFYHKKWYLSTHRKLDAFKSRWGSDETFGDIFLKCLDCSFEKFTERLNKYHVYFFLIRNTKQTRIVSNPPLSLTVYHVGTLLNNQTFNMSDDIGIKKQEELVLTSENEVFSYVSNIDPFDCQGVIGFKKDGSGKHFKIVNTKYQNYTKVRNNEPDVNFRYLELLVDPSSEMLLKLFLELYPAFKDKHQLYTNYTFIVAKYLHDMYFKKFIKKEKIVCQKDEWSILKNVHNWFWSDRANRKVTFNVMYKMSMNSQNMRSFFRIYKRLHLK
jgi:hypothetical protein